MLASDLANPEYVAPTNPDNMVNATFYMYAPVDHWASAENGIKTFRKEIPFIKIEVPGDKNTVIERPADGNDAKRWPEKWLYFQMNSGMISGEENIPGWKLDDWDALVADQKRQLKHLRFHTVEQLAGASDAQINSIGMGGLALRERAKRALAEKMDAGVKAEIEKRDDRIKSLEDKLERLLSAIEVPNQDGVVIELPKVKRKYTKKVKAE